MKKGGCILLAICVCSLCIVIGLFLGRNMQGSYANLPVRGDETNLNEKPVDFRIDINTATEFQLMELPGIGEITAQRIIAYRSENGPFSSVEDLINVEGIGEKKLQDIEAFVKIGG